MILLLSKAIFKVIKIANDNNQFYNKNDIGNSLKLKVNSEWINYRTNAETKKKAKTNSLCRGNQGLTMLKLVARDSWDPTGKEPNQPNKTVYSSSLLKF